MDDAVWINLIQQIIVFVLMMADTDVIKHLTEAIMSEAQTILLNNLMEE